LEGQNVFIPARSVSRYVSQFVALQDKLVDGLQETDIAPIYIRTRERIVDDQNLQRTLMAAFSWHRYLSFMF
jgi:hypothetical protein